MVIVHQGAFASTAARYNTDIHIAKVGSNSGDAGLNLGRMVCARRTVRRRICLSVVMIY
jgi:hypothetical protein